MAHGGLLLLAFYGMLLRDGISEFKEVVYSGEYHRVVFLIGSLQLLRWPGC